MPGFANSRSTTIAAPADIVRPLIDDLRAWQAWSPWEGLDPDLRRTYRGPDRGVGAHYEWAGNAKAGAGSMTVTESRPDRVGIDLRFTAPFAAQNTAVFDLAPDGDGTAVTWTMSGTRNPLMAVLGALYFDRAIGKDFERGLAALKTAAETAA